MLLSVQENMRDACVSLTEECGPVIRRNGDLNVSMVNVSKQRSRYMMDLYTTIVDAQWRYTLFIFISGFVLSWLFFGFIWYVIIRVHGDDLPQADVEGYVPCVLNVRTFAGAFLFSLETQHTIGYGVRAITEECPMAVCMLSLQSITGVILQAFMAGVVFAKLTRSKARANTLLFSRRAVVCQRDSHFVLMFRVADLRKSLIVGASVQAQLIRPKRTLEGEYLPFHMTKVNVGGDDNSNDLLFIWPVTIVHVIDETSPFYDMDASAMLNERFELVVYLEGTSESTGTTMQARYSYHNGDVMWGNRFQQCVRFDESSVDYVIDFDKFEKTTSVGTPLLSPRDWDLVMKRADSCRKHPLVGGDQLVMFNANHFKESCLQDPRSCSTYHSTSCRNSRPSIEYLIEHPITTDDLPEEQRQNVCPSFEYHSKGYQSIKRKDRSVDETEEDITQELDSGNNTVVSDN